MIVYSLFLILIDTKLTLVLINISLNLKFTAKLFTAHENFQIYSILELWGVA